MIAKRVERHRELLGQLMRYGLTGGLASICHLTIYWVGATLLGIAPLLANLLGYAAAVIVGYTVHSRWSFRGHGRRDNLARTGGRFVIVSLVSLALNSLWVWLFVERLGGPTWWPMPFMLGVTPLVVFWLNRRWVFE
jgi:putative flippase GtrA